MNRELMKQCLDALKQCTYDEEGYLLNPDNEDVIEALRAELAKKEPEPVGHQFQSRDGNWCDFLNQKHYEDTLADGSWPVRAIYAAPPEPNCKFPTCHSQAYQDKLVNEILEQEPVAYMLTTRNFGLGGETWDTTEYRDYQWDSDCVPLYTKGATNV